MSFISSTDSHYAAQIPISEAVAYLLTEPRKYTNWTEYRERYYRKIEQDEDMDLCGLNIFQKLVLCTEKYREYVDVVNGRYGCRIERDDAPEPPNKPFQRFCSMPDAWQERVFEIMTEQELHEHFKGVL